MIEKLNEKYRMINPYILKEELQNKVVFLKVGEVGMVAIRDKSWEEIVERAYERTVKDHMKEVKK